MENITLEQIDLIMQRANVSYAEAKEALEQCGGDTVEALLLLEKAHKINSKSNPNHTTENVKGFISKLHETHFILRKDEHIFIDVPLTIAILAFIFCCYVSIAALIIVLILGIKVEIKGQNQVADQLNSTIDLMKK